MVQARRRIRPADLPLLWPVVTAILIGVGVLILAPPARLGVPRSFRSARVPRFSVLDAAGLVPLLVGAGWRHLRLFVRGDHLLAMLRGNPASAGLAAFGGGLGLGLLPASAFSAFFWWWVGAIVFVAANLLAVAAVARLP